MPNGLMVLMILSILGSENQTQPVEESLVSLPGWKGYLVLGLSLSFVAMVLLSHPKKRKDCSKKRVYQKIHIWKLSLS